MKRTLLISLLLVISAWACAQLNPIRDLTWWHGYECPNNYYNLQWQEPLASATDTLVGYNVYRDNVLWQFKPAIGVTCMPYNCPDPGFLTMEGGWIKVTAVYNGAKLESEVTDSIHDVGIMIGIYEPGGIRLSANPVVSGQILKITLSAGSSNGQLFLYDALGSVVREYRLRDGSLDFGLPTTGLRQGVYFLKFSDGVTRQVKRLIVM